MTLQLQVAEKVLRKVTRDRRLRVSRIDRTGAITYRGNIALIGTVGAVVLRRGNMIVAGPMTEKELTLWIHAFIAGWKAAEGDAK